MLKSWKKTQFGQDLKINNFQYASIRSINMYCGGGAPYTIDINGRRLKVQTETAAEAIEKVEWIFRKSQENIRQALESKDIEKPEDIKAE